MSETIEKYLEKTKKRTMNIINHDNSIDEKIKFLEIGFKFDLINLRKKLLGRYITLETYEEKKRKWISENEKSSNSRRIYNR